MGHLMPVRSRDGTQDAKFPQDRRIIPFIKHLEENAEPRREAPQNLELGSQPGLQLTLQIESGRTSPGPALAQAQLRSAPAPTRMLRRARELPAGGGGGGSGCGGRKLPLCTPPR